MTNQETYKIVNTCGPDDKRLPDNARLKGIYEIGKQICAMSDPHAIIDNIIGLIRDVLPLERCIIASWENGRITPLSHTIEGLPEDFDQWPVSRSIVRRVLETGEAVLGIDRADGPLDEIQFNSVIAKQIKTFICTPLGSRDDCRGFIYVDSIIRKETGFLDNDFLFLTALSPYIHLALLNADTIEKEKKKREEYRTKYSQKIKQSIAGKSKSLMDSLVRLEKFAATDKPILLRGERGTGKELFARAVHDLSARSSHPFIPINVAAIPTSLAESHMMGSEKGAFSGAIRKQGYIEMADKGTLFLDEIGDMDLDMQAKLLRVLDDREKETDGFYRLGGTRVIKPDTRFVCATNKDLGQMAAQGTFRPDLFDRIAYYTITIPPLRERKGDIPILVEYFKSRNASEKNYAPDAIKFLESLEWEGNIRELFKVLGHVEVLCDSRMVQARDIETIVFDIGTILKKKRQPQQGDDLRPLADVEKEHIRKVLDFTANGTARIEKAAKILGVAKQTVHNKIEKYGLKDQG